MRKFIETNHCKSHVHCKSCREGILDLGEVFEFDGVCPEGFTVETIPETLPPPQREPNSSHEIKKIKAVAQVRKRCEKCGHYKACRDECRDHKKPIREIKSCPHWNEDKHLSAEVKNVALGIIPFAYP